MAGVPIVLKFQMFEINGTDVNFGLAYQHSETTLNATSKVIRLHCVGKKKKQQKV